MLISDISSPLATSEQTGYAETHLCQAKHAPSSLNACLASMQQVLTAWKVSVECIWLKILLVMMTRELSFVHTNHLAMLKWNPTNLAMYHERQAPESFCCLANIILTSSNVLQYNDAASIYAGLGSAEPIKPLAIQQANIQSACIITWS